MKGKKVLKTLLAAVMSVAIAVVFVPAFGQVDKASANDTKTISKIEIKTTEDFQLPLDDPDLSSLESRPYQNGKGDRLVITYTDGSSVAYDCTDSGWIFKGDETSSIILSVDEWVDLPENPVDGDPYEATVFVYNAPSDLGIARGTYIKNISVTVGGAARNVENFKLDSPNGLVLPESKDGTYGAIDISSNKGDKLTVEFTDDTTAAYTADENGVFYNDLDGNEWTALYFVWADGTEGVDPDTIVRDAGKTYYAYMYLKKGLNSGEEVYAKDEKDFAKVPVTIADHDWSVSYEWASDNKSVTATATCKNNASHTATETVNTTSEVTKQATYTEEGQTTYTAKFTNPIFETQTKVLANIAKLAKENQPMVVKAAVKTVKVKKLKKKAIKVKPIKVTNPKGKVTYKIVKGKKKAKKALKLNKKTGKITVKKKTKKGTYKLKIKVTAAGTNAGSPQYKAGSKTVWVTVKVK